MEGEQLGAAEGGSSSARRRGEAGSGPLGAVAGGEGEEAAVVGARAFDGGGAAQCDGGSMMEAEQLGTAEGGKRVRALWELRREEREMKLWS